MNKFQEWLENYIKDKSGLEIIDTEINFFSEGYLDSLEGLNLIEEIENQFKISIESSYFIDRRFPTVKGLAEIIDEIKHQK